jgi:hypothetical protein
MAFQWRATPSRNLEVYRLRVSVYERSLFAPQAVPADRRDIRDYPGGIGILKKASEIEAFYQMNLQVASSSSLSTLKV